MAERDPKRAAKRTRARGVESASVSGGARFVMDHVFGQHVAGAGAALGPDDDDHSQGGGSDAELWAIVKSFDARLSEAERRIDDVLARLGIA